MFAGSLEITLTLPLIKHNIGQNPVYKTKVTFRTACLIFETYMSILYLYFQKVKYAKYVQKFCYAQMCIRKTFKQA